MLIIIGWEFNLTDSYWQPTRKNSDKELKQFAFTKSTEKKRRVEHD